MVDHQSLTAGTAKKVIEKAKYKRGNSTRKISKQLKNKGLPGSAATVWRYMSRKGRKPLRRKSFHFWAKTRGKLAWYSLVNIVHLQQMNGKMFSLAMSALNTFFISRTLKTISYVAFRRVKFRHRTKLKEAPNGWFGVAWEAAALLPYISSRKDKL